MDQRYLSDSALALEPLLSEAPAASGALVVFAGTVRNHNEGRAVVRLRYTGFRPLAEKLMAEIERATCELFNVQSCRIVHRLGMLEVGDVALYCVVRGAHRAETFAACEHAVAEVKHRVPVWKEEFYADGSSAFNSGCCIRPDMEHATHEHVHHHEHHEGKLS